MPSIKQYTKTFDDDKIATINRKIQIHQSPTNKSPIKRLPKIGRKLIILSSGERVPEREKSVDDILPSKRPKVTGRYELSPIN